jgi:hypothetical protein
MTVLPAHFAAPEGAPTPGAGWKARAREAIGRVPAEVPEGHRRAYGLTLAGYLFMVAAQSSLFIIFLAAREFEIAIFAAAAAMGFGVCLVAHRRGYYRAPPYLATLIVVVEGFLGSYYFGAATGFQHYILGAIIYPWLAPFIWVTA